MGVKVTERWLTNRPIVSKDFFLVLTDRFFSKIKVICIWCIDELIFVSKHYILLATTKLVICKRSFNSWSLVTSIVAIEAVMSEVVPES